MHGKPPEPRKLHPIVRFIVFQLTWWLLVLSTKIEMVAEERFGLPSASNLIAALITIASITLILGRNTKSAERWILIALSIAGFLADSVAVTWGLFRSNPAYAIDGFTFAPPWLLALWLAFTAAVLSSIPRDTSRLTKTRRTAFMTLSALSLSGAILGPLSYLAGEPLGVLSLGPERALALAILALEWGLMFPLIAVTASRSLTFKA